MEGNNIIQLKSLCKNFTLKSGTIEALKDINLDIEKGTIFGIIGLSGAGKSTLVRTINLLEKPTSGEVIFEGRNIVEIGAKELREVRREISMIFQQFNLLMQRTALDNVCFPMELMGVGKKEARKEAMELLRVVGLENRAEAYPSQLSGGQKQRVAIARALATKPKVLLCDEATSALDPKTTRSILELLKEINKKYQITIVIITHEMSVVQQICHQVAIVEKGRIEEVGKTVDIFTSPKSEAGRRLVLPDSKSSTKITGNRLIRIVFDGRASWEPIISNMILACQAPVNIMYANTQNVEGESVGQMVVQLTDDDVIASRQMAYLKEQGVNYEEIKEVGADD